MRVIGIDPGTVTIDLCGLDDGHVFLDLSLDTTDALVDPRQLVGVIEEAHRSAPLDLVAGPSGYGLPLTAARELTETDLRLACLAADGEAGGIGGLRALMRALARSVAPVVLTPGVIHLPSVPAHRKVNRVDLGTADKVCAAALAIREEADRLECAERDVSFILLELGGAFTAAIAVDHGRIVDALGGASGPLGMRAAGALDGEVAFLAGTVTKDMLFRGGVETIAQKVRLKPDATHDEKVRLKPDATHDEKVRLTPDVTHDEKVRLKPDATHDVAAEPGSVVSGFPALLRADGTGSRTIAGQAYIESAVKAVAALRVSAPEAREVILSGRVALSTGVRDDLTRRLGAGVRVLEGFASVAKHAAQGAALIADGLAGGRSALLVETLGIRDARGTALDHLYVIEPSAARARLGIREEGPGAVRS